MKTTQLEDGSWTAELWLNNEQFVARGISKEDATDQLRTFLEKSVEDLDAKITTHKKTLKEVESWLWETRTPKMTQVVASCWDSSDTLTATLARLKQHMLEFYAKELGLENERDWTNGADHVVVKCNEQQILDLISSLGNKGCTDLHVYTEDKGLASMLESGMYGPFRICKGVWKA